MGSYNLINICLTFIQESCQGGSCAYPSLTTSDSMWGPLRVMYQRVCQHCNDYSPCVKFVFNVACWVCYGFTKHGLLTVFSTLQLPRNALGRSNIFSCQTQLNGLCSFNEEMKVQVGNVVELATFDVLGRKTCMSGTGMCLPRPTLD
jgi:hypothetical protein